MIRVYFSDFFEIAPDELEDYGALNISLLTDLPLFIDPFLLFNSENDAYGKLHDEIIKYLLFLCEESKSRKLDDGLIHRWFRFPEIPQTWLGFSKTGNAGRGLGRTFAVALNENFGEVLADFGNENVTKSPHLEKLGLISKGVGRDMISDFTTNLIKGFLSEYTQEFAKQHIDPSLLANFAVDHAAFNYETHSWTTKRYTLPRFRGTYVLLTPKDILAKDDTWINKDDLWHLFPEIPSAIPNLQLRAQINEYFVSKLPKESERRKRGVTKSDRTNAMRLTALRFPQVYDYYIKEKEDTGDQASNVKLEEVLEVQAVFIQQARELIENLDKSTAFYRTKPATLDDARQRVLFLKSIIEDKGGWRVFYHKGKPIKKEEDLQILFRLTWYGTSSDISREVNDGRGPVDFKASFGAADKTLVEMKLASNSKLRQNLENQLEIYKRASDAMHGLKVILFFTQEEELHVKAVLKDLKLDVDPDVYLIDARQDNKPSGSKA